jgi:hypothetical protein
MSQTRFISTASGKQFHFANPTADMIDIRDIAHALGNLCRFTGQCRTFYSVAEHSLILSTIVDPELAFMGLLHDATEAYCADIAKPLKGLLPEYEVIEQRIWEAIADKYDLPHQLPPAIKDADLAMLKREMELMFPPHCLDELGLPGEPADVGLHYWDPFRARYAFLIRFRELGGCLDD